MKTLTISISENGGFAYYRKGYNDRVATRIERKEFKGLFLKINKDNLIDKKSEKVTSHCGSFWTDSRAFIYT